MTDEPIIEVKNLWKRYGLPPFLPWKKHQVADHEWALRDISFTVPRGGSLGILGRNGAGKSTLLKLLAGVTPPDKGGIAMRGKVFPMIELTAGMSMELSGLENIRILGTIMGLNGKEIEKIIPEVGDFCELGDWLYKPVWQYSSGMVGRLAFGVAVNLKADILLVDEVLSTGDIMFQRKSLKKMYSLLAGGTTLIFVSHNPNMVERICSDGLLLQNGNAIFYGEATQASKEYIKMTRKSLSTANQLHDINDRTGSGEIRITNIALYDNDKIPITCVKAYESFIIGLEYRASDSLDKIGVDILISDQNNKVIAVLRTSNNELISVTKNTTGIIFCSILFNPLRGDLFSLTVKISDGVIIDMVNDIFTFSSLDPHDSAGKVSWMGDVVIENTWQVKEY
ncbi:MAG: ABC transporter ATP-binding protein [Clostridiales bacterium]|nr:ABC transporter ATP-binding protein [Clostridiales bacterium]